MARRTTRKRWAITLRKLKPAIRQEIETATERNAKDVADLARRFMPPDVTGALRRSTKAEGYSDGPAIRWRVVSGDDEAFYARMVEFGTAPGVRGSTAVNAKGRKRTVQRNHPGTPARPYFFPAYRALRKRVKSRLSRGLSRAKKRALQG